MKWRTTVILGGVIVTSALAAISSPLLFCAVQAHIPQFMWGRTTIGVGALSDDNQAWVWGTSEGTGQTQVLGQIVSERMVRAYDIEQPPEIAAKQTPRGPAPYWSIASQNPTPPHVVVTQEERFPSFEEQAYGWPARSMSYRKEAFDEQFFRVSGGSGKTEPGFGLSFSNTVYSEVIPAWLFYHSNEWPTHIIWRGMIVNVLFFAAVLGSPWWIRSIKRWRRARTDRCVRCGYSIAGLKSEKCPECGWVAVPPVARST